MTRGISDMNEDQHKKWEMLINKCTSTEIKESKHAPRKYITDYSNKDYFS